MNKGKVKFFCNCGKEIWQDLDEISKSFLTIEMAEQTAQCHNCLSNDNIKQLIEEYEHTLEIGGEG